MNAIRIFLLQNIVITVQYLIRLLNKLDHQATYHLGICVSEPIIKCGKFTDVEL